MMPFFFEFEESKSYVGTMRIELFAEILLDQPLPRVTPTQHDVLLQARRDNTGNGRLPRTALSRNTGGPRRRPVPKFSAGGH